MRAACLLFSLMILVACCSPVAAQQAEENEGRAPTISERFEQFRDSFTGKNPPRQQSGRTANAGAYSKMPQLTPRRGSVLNNATAEASDNYAAEVEQHRRPAAQRATVQRSTPEATQVRTQATHRATESRSIEQRPVQRVARVPSERVKAEPAPARSSRRAFSQGVTDYNPVSAAADPRRAAPVANVKGNPFLDEEVLDGIVENAEQQSVEEESEPETAAPVARRARRATKTKTGAVETFVELPNYPAERLAKDESEAAEEAVEAVEEETTMVATSPSSGSNASRAKTAEKLMTHAGPQLGVRTQGPARIAKDKPATYTITIANSGAAEAGEVIVAVEAPAWAEIVSADPSQGECSVSEGAGRLIEWRLPALATKREEHLKLELIPRESKSFELGVRWKQASAAAQAIVQVEEPKLEMTIDGPGQVVFGEKEIYRLKLSNPGTGDAENIEIHLLPLTPGDQTVAKHKIGTVPAGTDKIVEVELVARQTGQVMIKAEAIGDSNLRAEVAEPVTVLRAGLNLAVSAPSSQFAGAPVDYTVKVSNPGNAIAKSVRVKVALPPESECLEASDGGKLNPKRGEVVWTLSPMASGAERTLGMRLQLGKAGLNRVQVEVEGEGGLRDAVACATEIQSIADLEMYVVDPERPVPVGQDAVYEVRVANRGTRAAENVEIFAFFSNGIEPVAVEGGAGQLGVGRVTIAPIEKLGPGQELTYQIKARADVAGRHRFRAEVNCKPLDTQLSQEETTLFYASGAIAAEEDRSTENVATNPETGTKLK